MRLFNAGCPLPREWHDWAEIITGIISIVDCSISLNIIMLWFIRLNFWGMSEGAGINRHKVGTISYLAVSIADVRRNVLKKSRGG